MLMADEVVEKLGNVHLSDDEGDEIVLHDGLVQEAVSSCRFSFLGKLLSTKRYNTMAMKDSLPRAWGMPTTLKIVELDGNLFHFQFESEDHFLKVINGGPWNFDNHLLVIRVWEPGLVSKDVVFHSLECWVQIWGLPAGFITPVIGETVGNKIGNVIAVDSKAMAAGRGRFIRVRVHLSLDKPLKRGSNIVLGKGSRHWLDYKYERVNVVCFYCGLIGHDMNGCSTREEDEKLGQARPNKFGEEIKAGSGVRKGVGISAVEVGNSDGGLQKVGATGAAAANQRSGKGPLIPDSVRKVSDSSAFGGRFGGADEGKSNFIEIEDNAIVSLNGKNRCMGDLILTSSNLNPTRGGNSSNNLTPLDRPAVACSGPILTGPPADGPNVGIVGTHVVGPPNLSIPCNGLDNLVEVRVQENPPITSPFLLSPLVFKAGGESLTPAKKKVPSRIKSTKQGKNFGSISGVGSRASIILGKKRPQSEPNSGEGNCSTSDGDARKERRVGDGQDWVEETNPKGSPPAP
ncbi:hypothetical protein Vadar_023005 [Vaccinium darrowii]|uniref:Uncharacterized protein n=1 Tax=Vaccinium darrowii TaxID=229202 RepID=A0ACB7YNR7_9ERIC|nr:hypothetical protein Vadar_023005 [Vaccinium darrowii]